MKDNERQEIEKFGQLQENGIFTMTIIGEIEGHQLSAQNAKTTKYEHMIPALAKVEQDESIKGILILINTIGGDVECGLAIAELIASLSKPTVSLVLGGSHSIGVPLAVAADHSFIVKSATMMSGVPENIISTLNTLYTNIQINKLGLTEEQLKSITPNFEFSLEQTEKEKASGNVLAMMLMSIVLFYAIYFCAYQVSSSITTEKTSKIIETLVTSTSPKTIVLGKTLGIGIVGLLQMILLVGTALISAKTFLEPGILDSIIDVSKITPYLGIITIIYFIFGYFEYALLYALTGSTVSKPEDIQSANGPVAILAVIGFYLSYFTMMNPASELNVFASMFPISSPFCMPFRIMMGLAKPTDVIISIVILLITGIIIAKIAIKIYSNAILNYGTKMSFNDIVKMYKD